MKVALCLHGLVGSPSAKSYDAETPLDGKKICAELAFKDWKKYIIDENDVDVGDFVNELGFKFQNDFYTLKTGIKPSDKLITDDFEKGMNTIKTMKHIPKDFIYKKK